MINWFGTRLYGAKGRQGYLQQIPHGVVQHQLLRLYELMDSHVQAKESAKAELKELSRRYPEIREFKKISGIGALNASLFDAFIQTPHRFVTKRQLHRYCRLGVTERSSDGKPLGYQRLDRSGIGELKAISHRSFVASMRGDNEVKRFYQQSLARTHNKVHARLNTQRKVLSVMYGRCDTCRAPWHRLRCVNGKNTARTVMLIRKPESGVRFKTAAGTVW